jgi:hypothetical protein
MTTLVVLQPGYLPWLGFFDQMLRSDIFVYYDDVQFDKHGWRNRNRIKGQGGPLFLSVPVIHSGRMGQSIAEVEIDSRAPWSRKHMRTIRQTYAKAPFLEPYASELEAVLERPWKRLLDLNLEVTALMRRWLEIKTPLKRASELGAIGDQSARLLSICKMHGAKTYLSGDAARDYLDLDLFATAGVKVRWQDYRHPVYPQLHGPFISHLSALDLVLNLGPASGALLASQS